MFTNFPFFPEQASAQAAQVDGLYFFLLAITAFFSLLIAGLVVAFAIKFRRRDEDEVGAAIHGSLALELLWTIIPFAITLVMFAWGAKVFFDIYRPPAGAMEVYVVGKQWMWKAQHMDGLREINELHVPIGRPVKLIMASEDVIHSFYIPAFRVKADVIPGRYNHLWFTATKPGRYHLFCAEYCGTNHSGMGGWSSKHGSGAAARPIPPPQPARNCSPIWPASAATAVMRRHLPPSSRACSVIRCSCREAALRSPTRRTCVSRS
jgi:cytochrome c oxidase subunit 2